MIAVASGKGTIEAVLGWEYKRTRVDVVRKGSQYRKASDVAFLADTVGAIWTRVERSRWRSDAERDAFKAVVDRALAAYQTLAADAR
jgi:hypothetical protein